MAIDLTKVKEREALLARREPYWQRLSPGSFLGYRPSAREGAGTWLARAYDEETRRYKLKALGSFAEISTRERFATAKREAEAFIELIARGHANDPRIATVADACKRFSLGNREVEARFRRYVYSDLLASVPIDKLRRSHLEAWRARLEVTPALVSRNKSGERTTRPRAPATINRDMAVLRAALSKVLAPGTPNTQAAWQQALRPIEKAVRRRELYLDRDQRRALLTHVPEEAAPFVRALCSIPLRPGALAGIRVSDFDPRTAELTIGIDKSGKGRRIVGPQVLAILLASQAAGKSPSSRLLARANGKPWDKETWNRPIAYASRQANLPAGVTAYTLRHSTITDLVRAGLPLLTIAQISGTSAEMIEAHYGHLTRDAATAALAGLEL